MGISGGRSEDLAEDMRILARSRNLWQSPQISAEIGRSRARSRKFAADREILRQIPGSCGRSGDLVFKRGKVSGAGETKKGDAVSVPRNPENGSEIYAAVAGVSGVCGSGAGLALRGRPRNGWRPNLPCQVFLMFRVNRVDLSCRKLSGAAVLLPSL